jgi:putative membrane protein
MWHLGWGWGHGAYSPVWLIGGGLRLLVFAAIVVAVVYVVRALARRGWHGPRGESAREILEKRYARGEITREQFEQMKRDLE